MTHDAFIKTYSNKYVEFADPVNRYQCVDLMRKYIQEVWGTDPYILPRGIYAKNIYYSTVTNTKVIKIPNTPTGVPQKGDIIFWKTSLFYPWLYGIAGHVGVFNNGDVNNIISFDQNWPTFAPCHLQRHSYKDILGWIRKR